MEHQLINLTVEISTEALNTLQVATTIINNNPDKPKTWSLTEVAGATLEVALLKINEMLGSPQIMGQNEQEAAQ